MPSNYSTLSWCVSLKRYKARVASATVLLNSMVLICTFLFPSGEPFPSPCPSLVSLRRDPVEQCRARLAFTWSWWWVGQCSRCPLKPLYSVSLFPPALGERFSLGLNTQAFVFQLFLEENFLIRVDSLSHCKNFNQMLLFY